DLANVGSLADANRVDDVLCYCHRLRVRPVGSCLRLLVEFLVAGRLCRRIQLKRLDFCFLETRYNLLESLRRSALRFGTKQREKQLPIASSSVVANVDRADAGQLGECQYVPKRGVVAQVEAKPGLIEENEFA